MDGHKVKKPTKSQLINEIIPKQFEQKLREMHIKGMVQGFEVANQSILDYAENHTLEEVVEFCRKNVKNKDVMEKVVNN